MARTVEIGWQNRETEEEFRVTCTVTPGVPEQRWGDGAHPEEPPEVEVLKVVEDRPGGVARPDLIEAAEADLARLKERALEADADLEKEARERADEFAADKDRETPYPHAAQEP